MLLDGAVLLTSRHRYTAFAVLPKEQRPTQRVTLAVARGFQKERLVMERLDIMASGECLCPQLPETPGEKRLEKA